MARPSVSSKERSRGPALTLTNQSHSFAGRKLNGATRSSQFPSASASEIVGNVSGTKAINAEKIIEAARNKVKVRTVRTIV